MTSYLSKHGCIDQKKGKVEIFNYGRQIYDFMRWVYVAFTLSSILLVASFSVISVKGLNWGLDFTGGMVIEFHAEEAVNLNKIRQSLDVAGFTDYLLQNLGSSQDVIVRISPVKDGVKQELGHKVLEVINQATKQHAIIKRVELVGPSVGKNLVQDGSIAILVALICILIYISFRFEWRLATGVVLALIHDVVITLGVLGFFRVEIDVMSIASLMSVMGYSLNDSIVLSDRIRENFLKIKDDSEYHIFNISLTQTLKRTIITSAITLIVVIILLVFGGAMLRGFSIILLIGILIGTVSSIYVASALALKLGVRREHFLQQKVEKEGESQPFLFHER